LALDLNDLTNWNDFPRFLVDAAAELLHGANGSCECEHG
jgi:hypothetical protein